MNQLLCEYCFWWGSAGAYNIQDLEHGSIEIKFDRKHPNLLIGWISSYDFMNERIRLTKDSEKTKQKS